jgi:DNA-binding CsgD family transcriptional regulator
LFTPREREVLDLIADGLSNKLIADRLGISEHTAKFHVRSLMDKLGADTRADLVARAARRGLLVL